MIFFLAAVTGGLFLLMRIALSDRRKRQEAGSDSTRRVNGGP
jgi:hypothetical protein